MVPDDYERERFIGPLCYNTICQRKLFMRLKIGLCLTLGLLLLFISTSCLADVDLNLKSELKFKTPPVDMTFSRDGQWLYVLLKNGELVIYTYQGQMKGRIDVGPGFDKIEPGPLQDEIYLLSRKDNRIQIIEATPSRGIDDSASPYKGAVDAPVVIAEYTDFQCPYCAKLGETFSKLLKQYPGKIKIVYKSYPLSNHRFAWKAAAAAMAAHQKGRFWEFHDRLFEHYKSLDDQKIMDIRKEFGFDTPEFEALIKSNEVRRQVAADHQEGQRNGVRGTPTVFVNGKRLKDKSLKGFTEAIDKELESIQK
jgi:protein-disulfide isomerase